MRATAGRDAGNRGARCGQPRGAMGMRRPSIAHGSATRRASRPGLAAPEGGFALFEEGPNAFATFGLLEKAAEGFDFL